MLSSDLEKLEGDAKITAAKHVANILQRPDQLERVDQYRRRVARKKASVEAMLKTAVQSQLDGVRAGLTQLQTALVDVKEIKESLEDVDESYKLIFGLSDKLEAVKSENSRHSQLVAARENMKHIFTVPEMVKKTQDYINDGKLLHAHKYLTDIEASRDDLLFELYKQPQQSPTDNNTLKHYFAGAEKLSESLGKQLWLILQRTLSSIRREPTLIVTALRIIEREERTDAIWLKRQDQTGFIPPGRPKMWRERCFSVLRDSAGARIEGNQVEGRLDNKMWLVRHLEITRQLVVEDLRVVKTLCEPCFPPIYDIVNSYVRMYHESIGEHLNEMITQEQIEGNEIVSLMTWLNTYEGAEMMGNPDLKIDVKSLGPLLENNVLNDLQNKYLDKMRNNFQEWMTNSLITDRKDWSKEQEPEADGEGCYNTPLPVILFQMIEQNVQVASFISESLVKRVLGLVIDEMANFSKFFKTELIAYREKHLQARSETRYFIHYMIANVNNCSTFIECISQLKKQFLASDDEDSASHERFQILTETFQKIARDGCGYLLEEIFLDLETFVSELLDLKKWLSQESMAMETILVTVEDYSQDFIHLKPKHYENIICAAQERILLEYMKAILNRKNFYKNHNERKEAAEKMTKDAGNMYALFNKLGSRGLQDDNPFKVIAEMSEVIKLTDTSFLSLEATGIVNRHPDMRPEQLVALFTSRGDINAKDAKQHVMEIMGEEEGQIKVRPNGVFTKVTINNPKW
ncbi:exocyst complex component 3-like [Lineus longissimus]|uniref:exocyst complex component 3-like n=1 Tax=Lineus longissimus TaxID=88925 RepID=UPI002B4C3954